MQDSILLELKDFVENEGVYDKSAPPKFNEPYYGLYMQQKMKIPLDLIHTKKTLDQNISEI